MTTEFRSDGPVGFKFRAQTVASTAIVPATHPRECAACSDPQPKLSAQRQAMPRWLSNTSKQPTKSIRKQTPGRDAGTAALFAARAKRPSTNSSIWAAAMTSLSFAVERMAEPRTSAVFSCDSFVKVILYCPAAAGFFVINHYAKPNMVCRQIELVPEATRSSLEWRRCRRRIAVPVDIVLR